MSIPSLETTGLVKSYNRRRVVNDVSLSVRKGEIVGLLGPNGAGKTTTFYMTVGLVRPQSGKVFLVDEKGKKRDLTELPMYLRSRLGIGYLSQESSIFRKLTVADNIMAWRACCGNWASSTWPTRWPTRYQVANAGASR